MGLLIFIVFIIYFVPTWIAICRDHRNRAAIIILNVLLGWTLLGWVGALIWAVVNPKPVEKTA